MAGISITNEGRLTVLRFRNSTPNLRAELYRIVWLTLTDIHRLIPNIFQQEELFSTESVGCLLLQRLG